MTQPRQRPGGKAVAAALALAGLLASCGRCGGARTASSAEELLPALPPGAASTAPLAELARHADELLARAARLPGGEQLGENRRAVAAQLGFDPLTGDGLASAGLDPERGMAVALQQDGAGRMGFVAALPLRGRDAFVQTFEKLVRERQGYTERTEEARGEARAVVFARPGGGLRLGYALLRGYAVVARGGDPAADLAAAAGRAAEQSLARDARYAAARAAVAPAGGGAPDLTLFAPAQGAAQARLLGRALPGDGALGLAMGTAGVRLRGSLALAAPDAREVQTLLPGGGEALSVLLPKDAPLQVRLGIEPSRLPAALARVPALDGLLSRLRSALAARRVDLDRDLFGALQPGAVLAVLLSPRANLGRAVDQGVFDVRAHSPFDVIQLAAYARPADAARVQAALRAVAEVLPQFGARAEAAPGGAEWRATYAGGEGLRFGLRAAEGGPLVYLLGGLDPEAALAQKGAQGPGAGAAALRVDFARLAEQVAALPPEAYGSGPQSYVARSLVAQVIEPLRPLALRGQVSAGGQGLSIDLALEIAPAAGSPP